MGPESAPVQRAHSAVSSERLLCSGYAGAIPSLVREDTAQPMLSPCFSVKAWFLQLQVTSLSQGGRCSSYGAVLSDEELPGSLGALHSV